MFLCILPLRDLLLRNIELPLMSHILVIHFSGRL